MKIHGIKNTLSFNSKHLVACIIGTTFEWYDIAIFATMTPYLSQIFFPCQSHFSQIMLTFLIFSSGFLIRPIGAIIFGHLGDKKGRLSTLALTIIMMSISTTLIGCLPTYNSIGYAAPFALLLLRLIQGLAASGEYSGVLTYLYETGSQNQAGFLSSLSSLGIMIGTLLATATGLILNHLLAESQLIVWGWRIPFISSLLLGAVGYYIRSASVESMIFNRLLLLDLIVESPVKAVFASHKKDVCSSVFLLAVTYIVFYTIIIYIPSYLIESNKAQETLSLVITCINLAVMAIVLPFIGYICDKFNHDILIKVASAGFVILSFPLFMLIQSGSVTSIVAILIVFSILNAVYLVPSAKVLLALFPPSIRYTAMAIAFNIAAALFGGTAPVFMSFIEHMAHKNLFSFSYISFLSLTSIIIINRLSKCEKSG